MRRASQIILILSGTIFSIFIFNLVMCSMVPAYRTMLSEAVGKNEDIPVVDVTKYNIADSSLGEEASDAVSLNASTENLEEMLFEMGAYDEVPLAPDVESASGKAKERQIVGKEYHEDCGTGKGYWVITYEDGSTEIE
ncbi:MAG: hypothetical protein E7305_06380 [Butyrivibrio sp.]|nr:hypothetical protein [Butyrivibrio sp.]